MVQRFSLKQIINQQWDDLNIWEKYLCTMLKLCTVLMHACAWIIIPMVRAEADDNSTRCTVRVAADRVLPTCKYEYLLI